MGFWLIIVAALQGQEAPGLPLMERCGDEVVVRCRLPSTLTEAQARGRLGAAQQIFWTEGGAFHVLAKRASKPLLCCSFQSPMERVEGADDLWTLSVKVRDLDKAMLDVWVLPSSGGRPDEWRGPLAPPPPPEIAPRDGEITQHILQSSALGERRGLFIYRPEGEGQMPVIYMADGESAPSFAALLRPMIEAGEIPPVMIVGLWSGPLLDEGQDAPPNRRHEEYLAGWNDDVYLDHERFLLEEVLPLAERLGASNAPDERILAGFSDGAAWALNTAIVNPETFRGVVALSFGGRPDARAKGSGYGAIYLTTGTLEPAFYDSTVGVASHLESLAEAVRLDIAVAGHSQMLWRDRFPHAVRWLFDWQTAGPAQ